jgi:hypothetical protein
LIEDERKLLERLAGEGKTTRLTLGELQIAKSLEAGGLVFIVHDTHNAIITAKADTCSQTLSESRRSFPNRRSASRPSL